MVDPDTGLPDHLRVLFPTVPDDAVPFTDVSARLHDRALHRRLSSVAQGETVSNRQSTSRRRRYGHLLHLTRRHTGNDRLRDYVSEGRFGDGCNAALTSGGRD